MGPTRLSVDVHCTQPNWALLQPKSFYPNYRLYLNNELMAERTWAFGNDQFISEEIHAVLEPELTYIIAIHPMLKMPNQAKFIIDQFKTPDREHVILTSDDLSITFKVR